MSSLVVIGYENEFKAEEVRLTLRKLQKDYLIGCNPILWQSFF